MTVDLLQFILDLIVKVCSFEFLFAPLLAMAALSIVVRLILRRYS